MKRYLLIIIFYLPFLISGSVKGQSLKSAEQVDFLLNHEDITYDYEMKMWDTGRWTCSGTLIVSVEIPNGAVRAIFEMTRSCIVEETPRNMLFVAKMDFDNLSQNPLVVTVPDRSWGTYFRVYFVLEDGSRWYSQKENTNSFIREEDLKKILASASIEDICNEKEVIKIENNRLEILSSDVSSLAIFDLNGNVIFADAIIPPASIALDRCSTSIIIVRYSIKGQVITEKFKIS